MKGLFVKDLKLMMLQKNFLLLILAIVIGMMIFTDDVILEMRFCLHYLLHVIIM